MNMDDKDTYTLEEMLDRDLGVTGTPSRDEFDKRLSEDIENDRIGEAIRRARIEHNLTQSQLGERMGVKKAQVSKIERGDNPRFSTVMRAFRALGMNPVLMDGDVRLCF